MPRLTFEMRHRATSLRPSQSRAERLLKLPFKPLASSSAWHKNDKWTVTPMQSAYTSVSMSNDFTPKGTFVYHGSQVVTVAISPPTWQQAQSEIHTDIGNLPSDPTPAQTEIFELNNRKISSYQQSMHNWRFDCEPSNISNVERKRAVEACNMAYSKLTPLEKNRIFSECLENSCDSCGRSTHIGCGTY